MEPACEWRADQEPTVAYDYQYDGSQWSPPLSRGATCWPATVRTRALTPQWGPPVISEVAYKMTRT